MAYDERYKGLDTNQDNDWMSVLLALKKNIFRHLKVASLGQVVEVNDNVVVDADNNIVAGLSTTNLGSYTLKVKLFPKNKDEDFTIINCLSIDVRHYQEGDIVLVIFLDKNSKKALQQVQTNVVYNLTSDIDLHSESYGIVIDKLDYNNFIYNFYTRLGIYNNINDSFGYLNVSSDENSNNIFSFVSSESLATIKYSTSFFLKSTPYVDTDLSINCKYTVVNPRYKEYTKQLITLDMLTGIFTYDVLPQSEQTPSDNKDLTTKTYVDSRIKIVFTGNQDGIPISLINDYLFIIISGYKQNIAGPNQTCVVLSKDNITNYSLYSSRQIANGWEYILKLDVRYGNLYLYTEPDYSTDTKFMITNVIGVKGTYV